ncbi:hypothetical protein [Candidatus Magnetaquicoccus inordinatus]|uniref:hypothetical protein n=1 Tax=Candidatus Magnetaquicoccus inordinatus TaxID=2496818 RepID=UPI00102D16B2|nr:hypothetical protein [Candidatus Magnetaquicoccus inordinatus]
MEMIYYTAAGIFLYFISDWLLEQLERARGSRFPHRSILFFVIILSLSMATFHLIQTYMFPPPAAVESSQEAPNIQPPGGK